MAPGERRPAAPPFALRLKAAALALGHALLLGADIAELRVVLARPPALRAEARGDFPHLPQALPR